MSGIPTEAQFIFYGIVKDGWKHQHVDNVRDILADFSILDDDPDDFIECFFRYYDWYWKNQRDKIPVSEVPWI